MNPEFMAKMNGGISLEQAAQQVSSLMSPEPEKEAQAPESEAKAEETAVEAEGSDAQEVRTEDAESQADEETLDADQLSQLLGLETGTLNVDDEGKLRFRTKVDGEEGDATLADLLERYQRDAHLTNRSKEVAELKKKYESSLTEFTETTQKTAQQLEAQYKAFEGRLLAQYENIDWNELRVTDPAEYAARKAEMKDLRDWLKSTRDEAIQGLEQQWNEANKKFANEYKNYLEEQRGLLKNYIPNWNEETQKSVSNFLKGRGFADDEINRVSDARLVSLAHDAMLYAQGKSNVGKKLVKPLPKVLKPGAKPNASNVKANQIKAAATKLKQTGSLEDAVALMNLRLSKEARQ